VKHIILGVTGSIAAYKAAELANRFTKDGYAVNVIMTKSACEFITPITFQTLTKRKVYTKMFDEIIFEDVRHISLAQSADLALVAPASANVIGKLANGVADDMLTTVLMAVPVKDKPILIAPAMNTAMYENPATQENIAKLTRFGYTFIEPKVSRLAEGSIGRGALADVDIIIERVYGVLEARG
jgi:phosphopantothenoylcysteine decarboxylase/phosphopantothenoylcysteine decarboxylase/phosphopantothenate--cysteine ligase